MYRSRNLKSSILIVINFTYVYKNGYCSIYAYITQYRRKLYLPRLITWEVCKYKMFAQGSFNTAITYQNYSLLKVDLIKIVSEFPENPSVPPLLLGWTAYIVHLNHFWIHQLYRVIVDKNKNKKQSIDISNNTIIWRELKFKQICLLSAIPLKKKCIQVYIYIIITIIHILYSIAYYRMAVWIIYAQVTIPNQIQVNTFINI